MLTDRAQQQRLVKGPHKTAELFQPRDPIVIFSYMYIRVELDPYNCTSFWHGLTNTWYDIKYSLKYMQA